MSEEARRARPNAAKVSYSLANAGPHEDDMHDGLLARSVAPLTGYIHKQSVPGSSLLLMWRKVQSPDVVHGAVRSE